APAGTASFPADVHLNITLGELNVWLSAEHPDVHAAAIDPGEMVSVTLHFNKAGWDVGDPDLSARFLAGPSVLPDAFDELVTITRDDPPVPAPDAATTKVIETARGIYLHGYPSPYGYPPGDLALVAPGELVTYTVTVVNTGDAPGTYEIQDYWGTSRFTFQNFVVEPDNYYFASPYPGWTFLVVTDTLAPDESLTFTYVNEVGVIDVNSYSSNYVDVYDYDTGAPYDTDKGAWAGALNLGFRTTGSYKMAPATVLAGDDFTYNIRLANPSAEDRQFYFSDPLPAEVEFVSATGGATYNTGTHTVSWNGLLRGTTLSTVDFNIVVTARDTLTYSTVIQNQAVITSAQAPGGTLIPAGMLTAQTMVGTDADLAIEKSVDAIEGIVGDMLSYTVVFGNHGAERAVGVLMEDMVPAYLSVATDTLTATLPGVAYNGGLIRWTGNLDADAGVTVTFQATINDTAIEGLALINAATVEADNFPWRQYDSALTEVYGMQYIYLPLVMRNF
ncbi:MAG: DUF11 domain-containing protein, partial [Anaerolineae bacterium]|nr:DUF11 domain-containing protein [Anaerolineae bacterium]